MIIPLSPIDRAICQQVGLARNNAARDKGWKLAPGRKDIGIEADIIGCYGEYAVARFLRINWEPVIGEVDTQRGDVGRYQVKTVLGTSDHLIIRDQDPPELLYIMRRFLHLSREVQLLGWLLGKDGKVPQYRRTENVHYPCFFIPQSSLKQMSEFTR